MTDIFQVAEAILLTMSRFIMWVPQHLGFIFTGAATYFLIRAWFKFVRFVFLGPPSPSTKLFIAATKPAVPPNGMSKEAWISQELTKLPEIIAKAELEAEHEWRIENGEHEGCPKCKPKQKTQFGVPARLREPEPIGITDRLMRGELQKELVATIKVSPALSKRVAIPYPHPVLDRIDVAVLMSDGELRILQGTPSMVSAQPAIPINAKLLSIINVRAGASNIAPHDVLNFV